MGGAGRTAVCAAWLALGCLPAAAGISVEFENTAHYDVGNLRGGVLREIDRHLRRLAARHLRAGRSLRIEVLDLDLAGIRDPFRTGLSEPPIVTDATPPRFRLRYSLTAGGKVLAAGTETVRDPNYLSNPSARLSPTRLVHEKATLTRWFLDRLVRLKPPRGR